MGDGINNAKSSALVVPGSIETNVENCIDSDFTWLS